jgi:hypothetical protein
MPGTYTVRLTVSGRTHEATLTVEMDPRVKTPLGALQDQFDLSMAIRDAMAIREETMERLRASGGELPARLDQIGREFETLYGILQGSDAEPLPRTVMLVHELVKEMEELTGA